MTLSIIPSAYNYNTSGTYYINTSGTSASGSVTLSQQIQPAPKVEPQTNVAWLRRRVSEVCRDSRLAA